MTISVLGATGTIGRLVCERLEQRGHDVRRVSRGAGLDISTADGLAGAVRDAEAVVDCLNRMTLRRDRAERFFGGTAEAVSRAAGRAGVRRVVCVSIDGVTDPRVSRGYGYYAGKAAQERAYQEGPTPVTIVRSAQWFELIPTMVGMAHVGPVAVLPRMLMAPVAASEVARLVAEEVDAALADGSGSADRAVAIRGPERLTVLEAARIWLEERGDVDGVRPRVLWDLPYLGRAIASGALIPPEGATVAGPTLRAWLDAQGSPSTSEG